MKPWIADLARLFWRVWPRRLALKLIVSLTIIVGIIATVSGIINVKTQEAQLQNVMIQGADQLSRGITSATWHAMRDNHREVAYEVMHTIGTKQGVHWIRIFNKEGRIMFSTNSNEANTLVNKRAEACSMCHSSLEPLVRVPVGSRARVFRAPDGRRLLAMVTPIYNEPACSNAQCHAHSARTSVLGVLDVALDLEPVSGQVEAMKWRVAGVTGVQILLIGIFIIFFTRYFLSIPIRRLIEGIKRVSAMKLEQPITLPPTSEEVDHLADSFEAMRARLAAAMAEINTFTQQLEAKVERRSEQLRAAQQKLVQADRLASLGQLSATVAHEINNPIAGVLNLSMLMQRILKEDGVPPERVAEFRKHLTQVINETTRVGRIVSGLLAFSRRSKPQRTMADINRIIKTTLSLVAHRLTLGNIELVADLSPDLPLLSCDPSQIQQVVLNLVMNAAEAMQPQDHGRLEIATRAEGGLAIVLVKDTGEGIRPENLTRIFDPFFTTKGEGKGVGLGLAVLYGIVQAHGGDVEVTSAVGEGTTFTIRLPLAAHDIAGVEPPRAVVIGNGNNNV